MSRSNEERVTTLEEELRLARAQLESSERSSKRPFFSPLQWAIMLGAVALAAWRVMR